MKRNLILLLISLSVAGILIIPMSTAHVPIIPGTNNTLNSATHIDNPTKSWVVYGIIKNPADPSYFQLNMSKGEEIYAMLLKSTAPDSSSFHPVLAVIGPGLGNLGNLPSNVRVPDGDGYIVVSPPPISRSAEYEPFGADSFYEVSEYIANSTVTGTYYLAISSNTSGNYGLAVGQSEQYTILEWITLPYFLIFVYMWLGENILLVLSPVLITLAIGLPILYRICRRKMQKDRLYYWTAGISGLLFLGTGFLTIFQMLFNLLRTGSDISALITMGLAAMPLAIGLIILWLTTRYKGKKLRQFIITGILGVVGLFALGGLFIGPALAFFASISFIFRYGNKIS